jgi:hypothetical protein
MLEYETKALDLTLETKAVDDEGVGIFDGYASTFGNVDQGGDLVEPGAFIPHLAKAKRDGRRIPMLWNHDPSQPIGVWLDLAEDAVGLYVKGELLVESDPLAKRLHALVKRKAIGGLSIGYRIPPGGAEMDEGKRAMRLKEIDLREVSLVTMPMNLKAKIQQIKQTVWTLDNRPSARELEEALRDAAGFSKTLAEKIVAKAMPVLRGDPEGTAGMDDPAAAFNQALLKLLKV